VSNNGCLRRTATYIKFAYFCPDELKHWKEESVRYSKKKSILPDAPTLKIHETIIAIVSRFQNLVVINLLLLIFRFSSLSD
jgi:hypothetical protein